PTGPLHRGSLVAAMASYLDARAHHGRWLLRIEDIDAARSVAGADQTILQALTMLGMAWDGDVTWQSQRKPLYEATFTQLESDIYACGCSRREIADSRIGVATDGAAVYPGTCRTGLTAGKAARAWRVRVPSTHDSDECIRFHDRWLGEITQYLASEVGDFVLKRADGFWAYQLVVVADDADQGITDIVRGADLLDSTPRQIYLQHLLQLPTPRYLHVPVVVNERGEKLSKQTGALALDLQQPLRELEWAARFLGLRMASANSIAHFWERATAAWGERFGN
ncbi:MAG: tRNA glutamyl-Q(34) synthetase GluQRS, partial [Proteobacteria bacterium]|nr:tRNA glutamyl-Q(34) synthetase GluQRS [Pseudomonadota bacterium]